MKYVILDTCTIYQSGYLLQDINLIGIINTNEEFLETCFIIPQVVQKDMRDENGARLSILEQCRILNLSRATYYECCKFEAERQKKKAEENKIRLKRAKTVINEWSTLPSWGSEKIKK